MQVVVHSGTAAIPKSVRTDVQRRLERFEHFAREASRADVHLSEERNPRITDRYVCTVTVHLRHGSVTAHGAAAEPTAALDLVVEKLRHQLERLKDQRVKRAPDARRAGRRARTRS